MQSSRDLLVSACAVAVPSMLGFANLRRSSKVPVMDFSNSLLMSARRIGRQLGILQPLWRVVFRCGARGYEDKFQRAIMSRIQMGEVIWDVGANVGHYTRVMAEIVGASGHVVAFEPSPR